MGLTLYEFKDRELLLRLDEEQQYEGDASGWTDLRELAKAIGFDDAGALGSRMGWMRRYGFAMRKAGGPPLWRLTEIGRELAYGELRAAQQRTLDGMGEAQMLALMRAVSSKWKGYEGATSDAMRREWQASTRRNGVGPQVRKR